VQHAQIDSGASARMRAAIASMLESRVQSAISTGPNRFRGDLLGIKPRRAVEPRDQEERQRLGHHELPGKRKKLSHN
jgi:hypothetical protein